ncbi:hypothetical protein, partial [Sphingomonas sp. 2378]|uniref:hypothetical protein n=1 Tax=Sphingomonas sp. 2378 TaxID=1219748 RepID=UPI00311AE130
PPPFRAQNAFAARASRTGFCNRLNPSGETGARSIPQRQKDRPFHLSPSQSQDHRNAELAGSNTSRNSVPPTRRNEMGTLGILAAIGIIGTSMATSPAGAQRTKAAPAKQAKAATPQKSTVVKIHCEWADFEFAPDSNVADVVDRDFKDAVKTTVAELKVSPKAYVISWDRSLYEMLGLRTLRHRYLINRETGEAKIETTDEQLGMPTIPGNHDQKCTITS